MSFHPASTAHAASYEMTPPSTSSASSRSPPPYNTNGTAKGANATVNNVDIPAKKPMSRLIRFPLILLTFGTLTLGLVVLGLTGSTLATYNDTKGSADYFLPLWPTDVKTGPAVAGVACSALIVAVALMCIVFLTVPKLFPSAAMTTLLSSLLTLFLTLPPLIYSAVTSNASNSALSIAPVLSSPTSPAPSSMPKSRHSLASWACRWGNVEDDGTPAQFRKVCMQSRAEWGLLLLIAAGQVVVLGFAGIAVARRRSGGEKKKRGSVQEVGTAKEFA